MIFTLDVDFKSKPHKMLPHWAAMCEVNEKLQKEELLILGRLNRSIEKTRDKEHYFFIAKNLFSS